MKTKINRSLTSRVLQVGAFALSVSLFSCGNKQQGNMGAQPEYAVRTLQSTHTELHSSYPASIEGKQDIEIRPQIAGFITKVGVDEGAIVRKGQTLFIIDPVQYRAAVQQAEASVKLAKAAVSTARLTVKNKKELFKQKIIGDYELQTAQNSLITQEATLSQAQAQLITARQNLSYTDVKSPSNGVVGTIPYRVGSLVSSSIPTPLTIVSNIDEMYVYFSMTEKQLLEMTRQSGSTVNILKSFPEVQLKLADGSIYSQGGKIETVSGVIDPSTGSLRLRAVFSNPNRLLKSGGSGAVIIPYKLDNVIMIPQSATLEVQDKKYVFVVGADNKVSNKLIEISDLDNGSDYLVTSGLKAGDRIVVEGIASLKDGMQIKPITEAESAAKKEQAAAMSAGLAGKK
ncbi:efflux RND transporter periplasmic adaptor subunit [uncultured Bacteroides sp.]|uniref:efflux RND transporter periplasmic adaptor subunit n=1 Tax=uncultured Bacteroides sp. TaxID=162156 RepID=UPI002AAAD4F9|nr:efflux RND transporter periplasmic adaptor subunit [uncultured Bacteroides sp.]